MECEEIRVDLRTIPHSADRQRSAQLLFRLNHTLPFSEEYNALLRELLGKNLGEGSTIAPPLSGAALDMLKIGRGVFVNSNLLAMARGGITIGDHARIAANVQLLSNNHDPYDLDVLTCKPVEIGDYAWIGAGATVLPGVRVGRHAVIGAASVVTKKKSRTEITVAAHTLGGCIMFWTRICYHVSENSTNSGVSGLPISGSFLSNAESCAISSGVSVKSNRAKFSRICSGLVLLGMTAIPFCVRKRSRICAGVLPYFSARARTARPPNISFRLP